MSRQMNLQVVAETLREAKAPLRVREILNKAIDRFSTISREPWNVISRDLAMDIKDNEHSLFHRVGPGLFALREWKMKTTKTSSDQIDITGLSLGSVLAALHNNTIISASPLYQMQDVGVITEEDAQKIIDSNKHLMSHNNTVMTFDYLYGRPIKVSFVEHEDGTVWIHRADLYDRDSPITTRKVIDSLRG